jgi:CHAT domain
MNDIRDRKSILFVAANPSNTTRLKLREEKQEIISQLRQAGYPTEPIRSIDSARIIDLHRALIDYESPPQIVHFSGHGAGIEGLSLEDENGCEKLVSSETLSELFGLFDNRIECVVLNACYSEHQAEVIKTHVKYVIGMNDEINDTAAIDFARSFYMAIGRGKSYKLAYELGRNAVGRPDSRDYLAIEMFENLGINLSYNNVFRGNTNGKFNDDSIQLIRGCVNSEDSNVILGKAFRELKNKAILGNKLVNAGIFLLIALIVIVLTSSFTIKFPIAVELYIGMGVIAFSLFFISNLLYHNDIHLYSHITKGKNPVYIQEMERYRFIEKVGKDNYNIYDLTAPCLYNGCIHGEIIIVNAPLKKIGNMGRFAGKCSVCKEQHSYIIDDNFVATRKQDLDWSIPEKTK